MGFDIGFDLSPPLSPSDADRVLWDTFLKEIRSTFKDDVVFKEDELKIEFTVGEHPNLWKNGIFFRRFSSKITGSCAVAEPYITQVGKIAQRIFGDNRVHFWSECGYKGENYPIYCWTEVYAANTAAMNQ
jgi:hypothetical protein